MGAQRDADPRQTGLLQESQAKQAAMALRVSELEQKLRDQDQAGLIL